MSWLDAYSPRFLAPYNAAALDLYRQLEAAVPTPVQGALQKAEAFYHWAMAHQDPRVKDWPLMNPFHCLFLTFGYLLTVFVLVQVMKRRSSPFPTKYLAMAHNVFCTVLSLYMCTEIWRQAYLGGYSLFSNSLDKTSKGLPMATVLWVFYASKVPEFFDTILMALKKNFHQISFLHVYHHGSIFFIWWIIISYAPGGDSYFSAALNSFVHVVMYGYYLWSSLVARLPDGVKSRWTHPSFYKRYITRFQLIQFCLNFIQATYLLTVNPPADFPMFTVWILLVYMVTMLALFGNFYVKAYFKKPTKKDTIKKAQ